MKGSIRGVLLQFKWGRGGLTRPPLMVVRCVYLLPSSPLLLLLLLLLLLFFLLPLHYLNKFRSPNGVKAKVVGGVLPEENRFNFF